MDEISEIFQKTVFVKNSVSDLISKIDDFQVNLDLYCSYNSENLNKKKKFMQKIVLTKARPIRGLSAIRTFPGLNRASTTAKNTQRSKITQRSSAAFPGTPTSSRLSPGINESALRKSTSNSSLVNIGISKLSLPSTHRSATCLDLKIPKKSPMQKSTNQDGKIRKIPNVKSPTLSLHASVKTRDFRSNRSTKYAHVQSTIPKQSAVLGKRKTDGN